MEKAKWRNNISNYSRGVGSRVIAKNAVCLSDVGPEGMFSFPAFWTTCLPKRKRRKHAFDEICDYRLDYYEQENACLIPSSLR
eukprot:scaffold203420_cov27-Attheya_sp.AAC.1